MTPPRRMLGLSEAVAEGIVTKSLPAIRMWRNRYRAAFPDIAGWDGPEELFWEDELRALDADYDGARRAALTGARR